MELHEISPPARVLMTADTVGGVWSYALELCGALAPHGVRVALATMGAALREDQRAAAEAIPNVEVFEGAYKLEWMESPWEDVAAAGEWLLDLEQRFRPDVVHLNGYAHACLSWRVPVLIAAHSCVCSWFEAVRGTPPTSEWDRYRHEVARGLVCADLVTAPTKAMLNVLSRHYGPFTAGPVVYNGRRTEDYLPGLKEPFILTAGRLWDEAKNIGMLDGIAPNLPWSVYVAGEDKHPDGIGEAAFGSLQRLGQLTPLELTAWMRRASIYVLPARYEPFGLSALEAALAGCALVLGDLPSLREVWGDGAVFVPPDDPRALEDVLTWLIENDSAREQLSGRSRERALCFTPERMAKGYLELYGVLVTRGSPCPV